MPRTKNDHEARRSDESGEAARLLRCERTRPRSGTYQRATIPKNNSPSRWVVFSVEALGEHDEAVLQDNEIQNSPKEERVYRTVLVLKALTNNKPVELFFCPALSFFFLPACAQGTTLLVVGHLEPGCMWETFRQPLSPPTPATDASPSKRHYIATVSGTLSSGGRRTRTADRKLNGCVCSSSKERSKCRSRRGSVRNGHGSY